MIYLFLCIEYDCKPQQNKESQPDGDIQVSCTVEELSRIRPFQPTFNGDERLLILGRSRTINQIIDSSSKDCHAYIVVS